MPYLRTEWGVLWETGIEEVRQFPSALLAREFAENWNELFRASDPCHVVQRSISDWGKDD
jgi:hypothetical protein